MATPSSFLRSRRGAAPRPHAGGFTLVELLVVIAIILLLMTILIPSVRSGLESARGVVCATRCRDLVTIMIQRAADNRTGRLPPLFTGPTSTMVLRKWMWYLWDENYIRTPETFYCPSFDAGTHQALTMHYGSGYRYVPDFRDNVGDGDFVNGIWGVETTLAMSDFMSNRKLTSVADSNKAPVIMDCLFYRVNRPGDWDVWYDPLPRHSNRINVGYINGSVRRAELIEMYTTPYL